MSNLQTSALRSILAALTLSLALAPLACSKAAAGTAPSSSAATTAPPPANTPAATKAAAPPETDWLKKNKTIELAPGLKLPGAPAKKDLPAYWKLPGQEKAMIFYAMKLDELRASLKFLLADGGWTITDTRNISSIEVWVVEKGGERWELSTSEQVVAPKHAFVGVGRPL